MEVPARECMRVRERDLSFHDGPASAMMLEQVLNTRKHTTHLPREISVVLVGRPRHEVKASTLAAIPHLSAHAEDGNIEEAS